MIKKKIIICAILKNEERNLNNFFQTLKKIKNIFLNHYIILVESDSIDKSYSLSKKLIKNFNGEIIKTKTKKEWPRTKRIEYCRNIYLQRINEKNFLKKFDYVIILDADNVNHILKTNNIEDSLKKIPKNWIGIFPNQKFIYYDLWALRIKKYFDFDCYEKMISDLKSLSPSQSYFKNIFKNFFVVKNFKKRFIKVDSAFGGMAIYKLKYILKKKYSSSNGKYCEHVLFNKMLLKKNKFLYIDKNLINSYGLNEHFFKGIIYSMFNYFSKKLLNSKKI